MRSSKYRSYASLFSTTIHLSYPYAMLYVPSPCPTVVYTCTSLCVLVTLLLPTLTTTVFTVLTALPHLTVLAARDHSTNQQGGGGGDGSGGIRREGR